MDPVADRLFIGGSWVRALTGDTTPVTCSITEETIASVARAGPDDVDAAVRAAASAQREWARTPVAERAGAVAGLGAYLTEHMDDIADVITREVGTPVVRSRLVQVGLASYIALTTAAEAGTYPFSETVGTSLVVREPAGVAAALTPWNYPLHQAMCKVAPALVAGCTVVVKPSDIAPSGPLALARAAEALGLPPGVINVVTGGVQAGRSLVDHDDVDVVSFTGSTAVGRQVAAAAAGRMKRITMELGGKSAAVVLDDADLGEAVSSVVRQAMFNGGQTCIAWTRLIVPRSRHDEAAKLAAEVASSLVVGDPRDEATEVGPLASGRHRDLVRGHIARAETDGARLVCGGTQPPPGLDRGYFVAPSVFAGVDPSSALAQDEVFGPVLAVLAHDGDDHAVELANHSDYGLHGAVFSADSDRARAVAARMRTGRVDIGNAAFNPLAPMGGYKQSGLGREFGRFGIDSYVEIKAIQLP